MALVAIALLAAPAAGSTQVMIRPSDVNPAVRNGDTPYLVWGGGPEQRGSPLVVFMPGTNGTTARAPLDLLRLLAEGGYRVIYLSYDDKVAGTKICPNAAPGCFAAFRSSRLYGGDEPVRTSPDEAIVPRLTQLLRKLEREHPDAGWNEYLTAEGPNWPHITLSGLSQGAGMAAFVAKRHPVGRVVLFSSPWDFLMPGMRPAPWLFEPSITPPERWWAERHVRENTTRAIANAYRALRIPPGHILLFDGPKPPDASGPNPFHPSTVKMAQYAAQWRVLYGLPTISQGEAR